MVVVEVAFTKQDQTNRHRERADSAEVCSRLLQGLERVLSRADVGLAIVDFALLTGCRCSNWFKRSILFE